MKSDIVAQRYAHALFALGKEQGMPKLEAYSKVLNELAQLLETAPELTQLFRAPVISVVEKQHVLSQILERLGAEQDIRHFCFLLAERERLPLLATIIVRFRTLLDKAKDVVRGCLVTAVPVSDAKQADILSALERKTSKQLVLRFEVNPSILGGIVLQVGDRVLDASLRAQLNSLRETIKRGE